MRVRLVTGTAGLAGALAHARAVGRALADRGHHVEVWSPRSPGPGDDPMLRGAPVSEHDLAPSGRERAIAAEIAAAVAAEAPADVHHAHDRISALALLSLRAAGGAPVVRTVHHVDVLSDPALDEIQRISIQDPDALVSVSEFWAERLRAEYGVAPAVVRNGVDVGRFAASGPARAAARAEWGWGERPVVLSLGGVDRRKGSRVLLEAFARARTRIGDDALLAVAGEHGPEDSDYRQGWLADARRLGLEVSRDPEAAPVVLLGRVADESLPGLFRAADLLAYPSTREGSALAVLEAASAWLPAVVSELPALAEHLEAGRDCLMVPSGDSGPLAEALVRLAGDPDLRRRIAAAGRERAQARPWDDAAASLERVYAGLVGPAAAA